MREPSETWTPFSWLAYSLSPVSLPTSRPSTEENDREVLDRFLGGLVHASLGQEDSRNGHREDAIALHQGKAERKADCFSVHVASADGVDITSLRQ